MPKTACDELGIPRRLHTKHRQPQPFADKNERLYRRVPPNVESDDKGDIAAAALGAVFQHPRDVSCNRQRYCSAPQDVLYNTLRLPHYFNYGIIEAQASEIDDHEFPYDRPGDKDDLTTSLIRFKVAHTPDVCMYPHSEIFVFQDGLRLEGDVKPKTLKTLIREELRPFFKLVHEADSDFDPATVKWHNRLFSWLRKFISNWWL